MFPATCLRLTESARRAVAEVMVGVVVALGLFAASPVWHAWLHETQERVAACSHGCADDPAAPHEDAEAGCVVALFALGHVDGFSLVEQPAPPPVGGRAASVTAHERRVVSDRRLPPGRGPPSV